MGPDKDTYIEPGPPLVLGPFGGCGEPNKHIEHPLAQYRARGLIITRLCIYCCFKQREAKRRTVEAKTHTAEAKQSAEEAMVKAASGAGKVAEAARKAEEDKAGKSAVIRAEEPSLPQKRR